MNKNLFILKSSTYEWINHHILEKQYLILFFFFLSASPVNNSFFIFLIGQFPFLQTKVLNLRDQTFTSTKNNSNTLSVLLNYTEKMHTNLQCEKQ